MTELQKTEFELLKLFVGICEKHKLKYYLVCGSALGAEKYGGFIPWDDDIDVALPRPDYEKFLSIAQGDLPENVFLQNIHTESAVPFAFSKLRDSNTSFFEKTVAAIPINHGVYIDVFPLDGYPKSKFKAFLFEMKKKLLTIRINCVFDVSRIGIMRIVCSIERCFGMNKRTEKSVLALDKLYKKYSLADSEKWCNFSNWQGKLEYANCNQYGDGKKSCFEGLNVIIPDRIDEYLTQKYGDWRSDLPEEEKTGHHYYTVLDLSKPYTNYFTEV